MFNKNSNLMSGFIGTVIGAFIGVGATMLVVYFNFMMNFTIDNKSALIELKNIKRITETIGQNDIPKYKLLNNINVDWKTVLLDINNENTTSLYYKLVELDTLLERIHQTGEDNIRKQYIKEYNNSIKVITEHDLIDDEINRLATHLSKSKEDADY